MSLPGQIDLNSLLVFDAVMEAGGFTAAAERLGVAKAKVSIEIGRLEARLGQTLFARTTRQVTPTEAGRALHAVCRPLLAGLREAVDSAGHARRELEGSLRISTSVDHAVQSLAPAIAEFSARHPALEIDLRTGDRVSDMVGEGIDLAIRLGWLRDSSLRAVRLGEFEQYLLASPAYLQRAGWPRHPQELGRHDWIALMLLPTPLTWKFSTAAGESCTMQMKARLRVDSPAALRTLLQHDAGISVLDQYSADEALRTGRLVRLLPEWSMRRGGIHAVYPPGRHVALKVRRFIDFYGDWLRR